MTAVVDSTTKPLRIDRLVLGGAGNRVHALLGAIYELRDCLDSCHHFIGVSAGAIIATLLALRRSVKEIVIEERQFPFTIHYTWFIQAAWQLLWHGNGLIPIEELRAYIAGILDRSRNLVASSQSSGRSTTTDTMPSELVTFDYLYHHNGMTLEIQAMDWHTGEPFLFNRRLTPDTRVVDAITASCAIPVVFSPFEFQGRILCDSAVFFGLPWNMLHSMTQMTQSDPQNRQVGQAKSSKGQAMRVAETKQHFMPVLDADTGHTIAEPFTVGIRLSSVCIHGQAFCKRPEVHTRLALPSAVSTSYSKLQDALRMATCTAVSGLDRIHQLSEAAYYGTHRLLKSIDSNLGLYDDSKSSANQSIVDKSYGAETWSWSQLVYWLTHLNGGSSIESKSNGSSSHDGDMLRGLHHHQNIIHVYVDPVRYGSKLYSLCPSDQDKRDMFKQSRRDARAWRKELQ